MTKPNSPATEAIIRKIHLLLSDIDSGEEIIDFLRSTEPVFMKEVGQFVHIELDKLKDEFEEEFILYMGSVIGAAYIMGFLIAREIDHKVYDTLIPFDSLVAKSLGIKDIDKIIDKNLEKGKKPKEIGKIITNFYNSANKPPKGKKKKKTIPRKLPKKKPKIDIEFDEGEL